MDPLKIMFISNGKGEDSIACTIVDALKQFAAEEDTPVFFKALPLVGPGKAYSKKGIDHIANWRELPSGGFGGQRISSLFKDISAGLLHITKEQISMLHNESASVNLIVCVGDIYPVVLAAFFANKPIIHIATAISAYFHTYTIFERWLFKKYCKLVITRDEKTAVFLKKKNIASAFFGNPMMDDPVIKEEGIEYQNEGKKLITLAPSSREDAYENIVRMLKVIKETGSRPSLEWIIALAPTLIIEKLRSYVEKNDWTLVTHEPQAKGFIGEIKKKGVTPVKIVLGHFGDLIRSSTIVIGMTGTGNEQVVGLATPVFLLRGKGVNATWRRIIQYRKLLGESIFIAWGSNKRIAQELLKLIHNNKKRGRMALAGKERMGSSGGSYSIARVLYYEAMKNYYA